MPLSKSFWRLTPSVMCTEDSVAKERGSHQIRIEILGKVWEVLKRYKFSLGHL